MASNNLGPGEPQMSKPDALGSTPENCGGGNSLTSRLPDVANKVCDMVGQRTLVIGAAAAVGAAAAAASVPYVLPAVGFGTVGVTAGSKAAAIHSGIGAYIAKGSLFSLCQHWGAVGLPAAVQAATAAAGAGLGGSAAFVGTSAAARSVAATTVHMVNSGCAAVVGASAAAQSVAAKTVAGLGTAANTVAAVPGMACSLTSKAGPYMGSASAAVKAGAIAAGKHLGIGRTGAASGESLKPPAARL